MSEYVGYIWLSKSNNIKNSDTECATSKDLE